MERLRTGGPVRVRICPDPESLARIAAAEFAAALSRGVPGSPRRVLLSGGKTPEPMYRLLAARPVVDQVDWKKLDCYFADERPVPPDHPDSNYGLARRSFLDPLGSIAPRAHRIPGEAADLALAAERYEAMMRERFGVAPPAIPSFDLVLLGLGSDGHVASLFPGGPAPDSPARLVIAVHVATLHAMRITVTLALLNAARRVLFLVAGQEKAEALARTLAPVSGREPTAAARVAPASGDVLWLVDRAAASRLPRERGLPIVEVGP